MIFLTYISDKTKFVNDLSKILFFFVEFFLFCFLLNSDVFVLSLGFQNLFFKKDFKKIFFLRRILLRILRD